MMAPISIGTFLIVVAYLHNKIIIVRVKRHHCNSVFCRAKLGWRNLLKIENKPTQSCVGLLKTTYSFGFVRNVRYTLLDLEQHGLLAAG